MNIRKFTSQDYNAAYSLWQNTPGVSVRKYDDSEAEIIKFLDRNPNTCFIVELQGRTPADNQIIGTIMGGNDGRRGYIYHLTVAENYRNQGIGKMLVDKVIEAFKNEGLPKIALFCLNENTGGNSFWEKYGFEVMDEAVTWAMRFID
ncbi:MAG: GNAT family N-acetyltransferase [Promicromonosporaceae bacterium]|nr:GNAT family N-acetyltransferase [Promicromonosporaceae bacterium]